VTFILLNCIFVGSYFGKSSLESRMTGNCHVRSAGTGG